MTQAHQFQDLVVEGKDVEELINDHLDTSVASPPWSFWIFDDGSMLVGRDADEEGGQFSLTSYKVDPRNA